MPAQRRCPIPQWWGDTRILIPPDMQGTPMRDALRDDKTAGGSGDGPESPLAPELRLAELLAKLPISLKASV